MFVDMHVHGSKRLGYNAGYQEVSRCHTRGQSEEFITCRWQSMQVRDPPWLWNPGHTSPEVRNMGPTKRTYVLQNILYRPCVSWRLSSWKLMCWLSSLCKSERRRTAAQRWSYLLSSLPQTWFVFYFLILAIKSEIVENKSYQIEIDSGKNWMPRTHA